MHISLAGLLKKASQRHSIPCRKTMRAGQDKLFSITNKSIISHRSKSVLAQIAENPPKKMLDNVAKVCYYTACQEKPLVCAGEPVAIAKRVHPFPSRTRKLSSSALMILWGQPHGKIRRCRFTRPYRRFFVASPLPLSIKYRYTSINHSAVRNRYFFLLMLLRSCMV